MDYFRNIWGEKENNKVSVLRRRQVEKAERRDERALRTSKSLFRLEGNKSSNFLFLEWTFTARSYSETVAFGLKGTSEGETFEENLLGENVSKRTYKAKPLLEKLAE